MSDAAPTPTPALLGFFAGTFVWSWALWGLSAAVKVREPEVSTVLLFVGSFGPSMAAVFMVASASGPAGLRAWFSGCLRWRIGWGWWAFTVFFPLVLMLVAVGLHVALGGKVAASPAFGHLPLATLNFFAVMVLGGPLGEELGWRGYALPAIRKRMGWRTASVALGLVWGLWHLPLFLMEGTSQAQIPIGLFLLSVVAMSVLFAWVADHTHGSVLAALVLHTSINFGPSVIPVMPTALENQPYALVVALLSAAATVFLVSHRPAPPGTLRQVDSDLMLGK